MLSIRSGPDFDEMRVANAFHRAHRAVEAIGTGEELPTMQQKALWMKHPERTGAEPNEWVPWGAHDDQV